MSLENYYIQSALEKAIENQSHRPTLLLGNGFSIDFDKEIFGYEGLLKNARDKKLFQNEKVLSQVCTFNKMVNFEQVMGHLEDLKNIFSNFSKEIQEKKEKLKEIIIKALGHSHPNSPHSISQIQFECCAKFLRNFKAIYTLNYDLLLYWVILKENLHKEFKDCFKYSIDKDKQGDNHYVNWYLQNKYFTTLYYLHGGLHLYGATHEIIKYCFSNGRTLKEQIIQSMNENRLPLFVSGETYSKKIHIINSSDYLSNALNSLKKCKDTLFIHGFNFNENDWHIMEAIASRKIEKIFISLYRENNIDGICKAIDKIKFFREKLRDKEAALEAIYYDAESAKVWR